MAEKKHVSHALNIAPLLCGKVKKRVSYLATSLYGKGEK
jgi:hypothetical protein